ncbi:MAG: TIM barrel protein [Clostridia bacterium]|nr:TIM barrel protein [Clostridia bacterium]
MLVGFTSTTFLNIKSLEKIVKIAVDCGADCIEWGGNLHVTSPEEAKKAKELCSAAKIKISSYGSYYRVGSADSQEWKRICEIASAMGAPAVRVWLGNSDSEKTDAADYDAIVSDAKAMCAVAAEYGISVCCECHGNTYNNNTDAFLKIRSDIGADNFRTYFQSRYCRREYDLDRIERTLPFTELVHISYSEQRREQFPKRDSSYIGSLLDKLVSVGFDGDMLVEFTYPFMKKGIPLFLERDIKKLKAEVGCREE